MLNGTGRLLLEVSLPIIHQDPTRKSVKALKFGSINFPSANNSVTSNFVFSGLVHIMGVKIRANILPWWMNKNVDIYPNVWTGANVENKATASWW